MIYSPKMIKIDPAWNGSRGEMLASKRHFVSRPPPVPRREAEPVSKEKLVSKRKPSPKK